MTCSKCGRDPSPRPMRRGLCPACYEKGRLRQIAYGRWDNGRAEAGPVREHIAVLHAAGVSYRRIAVLAGLSRTSLSTILHGKNGRPKPKWIHVATAQSIRAIPVPATPGDVIAVVAPRERVSSVGTARRLQALVSAGWSMSHLARELGMHPANFGPLVRGERDTTAARHREAVALFDRLQTKPGPSARARNYGARNRWPLPFQWDEESIDDPDAGPVHRSRRESYRAVAS